jgi:hypothetical protein
MNTLATLTFKAHGKRHTITIPHDPSGAGYIKALKRYAKENNIAKKDMTCQELTCSGWNFWAGFTW